MLLAVVAAVGCSSDAVEDASRPSTTFPPELVSELCEVQLHGRTEQGAAPRRSEERVVLRPDANRSFEQGGRVWIYDTESEFREARDLVGELVQEAGCEAVVLHGFSNGAAFAAKLACSGETFDSRLVGVVVDDPVADDSSPDCTPGEGVDVALYWTGAIPDEGSCRDLGWTCAGGDELVGIAAFAERLGAAVQNSPEEDHRMNEDPPEIPRWLGLA